MSPGLADEANLEATLATYRRLVADIKAVDPSFVDAEILPEGGIAGLSWQGRNNLIDDLLLTRASALYRGSRRRRPAAGGNAAVSAEECR